MKTLKIEAAASTPAVLFDKENNKFQISGNSYPENVIGFYEPIVTWLEIYVKDPNPVTTFDIHLKYISSNSLKQFLILLKTMITLKENYEIIINWFYDPADDDMLERGEFLSEMTNLEFNYIAREDK